MHLGIGQPHGAMPVNKGDGVPQGMRRFFQVGERHRHVEFLRQSLKVPHKIVLRVNGVAPPCSLLMRGGHPRQGIPNTPHLCWTLAFFASLTLVDTENVARRVDNRSVSPPPDRPSPARCVRVRSDVDARHQLENASVPWRGHDSSAIVKMPGPERLLQTTFLSLRRTAPESRPNPIAA